MISRFSFVCGRKLHQSKLHGLSALAIQNPFPAAPSFHSLSKLPSSALQRSDWLSPNEVLSLFDGLQDPNAVKCAWDQYTKRRDYKPNEAIYSIVIKKLALAKNFEAIEEIMQRIKVERSCRLSDDFFYGVIKIYGQLAGRIKKAIETLLDMPRGYNCWPTVKTFNLVLDMLVSAKLFEVVDEIYLKAPLLGVEIDACCLNILIKALCQNAKLEAAFSVLDEFPKQRCRPNVRTFSTLMHGLCEKGKVEEALGLLERMEEEGIDTDTITFNILISGLRKQGRLDDGMKMLQRMKLKGCEPNPGSYQEVLYGFLDAEKFVEAKEFMCRMLNDGFSPSFDSYKKLIHGLCKERLIADVDWALKQMVKQGFVPKMGMWRHMLGSVCSRKNPSNINSLVEILDGT